MGILRIPQYLSFSRLSALDYRINLEPFPQLGLPVSIAAVFSVECVSGRPARGWNTQHDTEVHIVGFFAVVSLTRVTVMITRLCILYTHTHTRHGRTEFTARTSTYFGFRTFRRRSPGPGDPRCLNPKQL